LKNNSGDETLPEVPVKFEDVAEAIELPDNSGRRCVTFRPRGILAGSFVADVTITMESFEDVRRSELSLTAVPLSRDKLIRLDELLTVWLTERTPFEIDLAQDRWARFAFTVGPDSDYISSNDKPAFRIDVDWCSIAAVAVLVVDQSCMRLFHEGVAGWLRFGG
jgi:hypothetical protein